MELKELLINSIVELDGCVVSTGVAQDNSSELRAKAIEFLKQKGYELNETNLQFAMNSVAKQEEELQKGRNLAELYSEYSLKQIANIYNEKIADKIGVLKFTHVEPEDLVVDEMVQFSCYTFLPFDTRSYESLDSRLHKHFQRGMVGGILITDTKLIMDYFPTIFPMFGTISANKQDVTSVMVTGVLGEEIEIALKSGQRIRVVVPDTVNTAREIIRWMK